jgi:hypothetical protein
MLAQQNRRPQESANAEERRAPPLGVSYSEGALTTERCVATNAAPSRISTESKPRQRMKLNPSTTRRRR